MKANVTVYTTNFCPYCERAKFLLKSKGVTYQEYNVATDRERFKEMVDLTKGRTMPQIIINDQVIGGYDDMAALDAAGKLDELLEKS